MKLQGEFLGTPYDLRLPTHESIKERVWNPQDEWIWPPIVIGAGWSLNLPKLREGPRALFVAIGPNVWAAIATLRS